MAVPKRKKSKSRTGMHRSHCAIKPVNLATESISGDDSLPHHVSPSGYYKGRLIFKSKKLGAGS